MRMYCSRIAEYSSWPAVSSTSSSATSSSTMHCFRYESVQRVSPICRPTIKRERKELVLRTLDGRVIFVNEMRLDQLDCEARFADATTAHHHQLVFSRKLQR